MSHVSKNASGGHEGKMPGLELGVGEWKDALFRVETTVGHGRNVG